MLKTNILTLYSEIYNIFDVIELTTIAYKRWEGASKWTGMVEMFLYFT